MFESSVASALFTARHAVTPADSTPPAPRTPSPLIGLADFLIGLGLPPMAHLWQATLRRDYFANPAVGNIRQLTDLRRQYLYVSEVVDLALDIQPRYDDLNIDVLGQICLDTPESRPWQVTVTKGDGSLGQDARIVAETQTDTLGQFSLRSLRPGTYHLILNDGVTGILVGGVEVEV